MPASGSCGTVVGAGVGVIPGGVGVGLGVGDPLGVGVGVGVGVPQTQSVSLGQAAFTHLLFTHTRVPEQLALLVHSL